MIGDLSAEMPFTKTSPSFLVMRRDKTEWNKEVPQKQEKTDVPKYSVVTKIWHVDTYIIPWFPPVSFYHLAEYSFQLQMPPLKQSSPLARPLPKYPLE